MVKNCQRIVVTDDRKSAYGVRRSGNEKPPTLARRLQNIEENHGSLLLVSLLPSALRLFFSAEIEAANDLYCFSVFRIGNLIFR